MISQIEFVDGVINIKPQVSDSGGRGGPGLHQSGSMPVYKDRIWTIGEWAQGCVLRVKKTRKIPSVAKGTLTEPFNSNSSPGEAES